MLAYHLLKVVLRQWETGPGWDKGSTVKLHRNKKQTIPLCGKNKNLIPVRVACYEEVAVKGKAISN
jgi:hypothetical protein